MTPAEAAELLAHCAAFDHRTIGESDARAWARALHDVPLDDDTRDAVAEHYAHTDKWITVAQVRDMRARIRTGRIDAAHPVYDGNPDETGEQFITRRQAQIIAAAEGNLPARTITQAIGTGPSSDLLALTSAVGHRVDGPAEAAPYVAEETRTEIRTTLPGNRAALVELAVACPNERCRADIRHLCKNSHGTQLRNVHGRRRDAYAVECATCPECDAPPRQPCNAAEPHPARIRAARADRALVERAEAEHNRLARLMSTPPQPRTPRVRHTSGGTRR
ncbi:hypothetical protein SMD44_05116 [Streptomyces alboflavus]|uniref:Uncharacterized protein n=1 Tax=Streptomyces alboflavus TaxID=67267 RepID=A0A1Z1WH47_9ACTN|nr:hypothetical protein [Streptomyces alboflavus]ARX85652.1 hypothetical protein SMD44_05116 [Streptomyces alboflavus]